MTVTFDLEDSIQRRLCQELGDLGQAAKQALLIDAFRSGKLSHHELAQALGLDRFATDALLQRHGIVEGSLTMKDLEADRRTLERVLGPVRR